MYRKKDVDKLLLVHVFFVLSPTTNVFLQAKYQFLALFFKLLSYLCKAKGGAGAGLTPIAV